MILLDKLKIVSLNKFKYTAPLPFGERAGVGLLFPPKIS